MPATLAKDYWAAKPGEKVKCYECQKVFANKWTLGEHLKTAHGIS